MLFSAGGAHRYPLRSWSSRFLQRRRVGQIHATGPHATHVVLNQSDLCKKAAALAHLTATGAWAGAAATAALARAANANGPVLRQFDRNGRRVDTVDFTPAYHELMRRGIEDTQAPSYAWGAGAGGHVTRAALAMLTYEAESGTACPLTMTFAAVPALAVGGGADLSAWADGARQAHYDPRNVPPGEKRGLTIGMSMTEKQGGSDVRSNTTTAVPLPAASAGGADGAFALRGHKWFTSAPMCDGFLTLAYGATAGGGVQQQDGSLSCFLVPRWLPDGSRNSGFRVMRLKEKLGDRSNASSEVEYDGAIGFLLGARGSGVANILEMVVHTRLDCALGSAALMRQSVRAALNYAAGRRAFGATLSDAPAMQAVLAELAVESEAAVWMSMLLARAFEDGRAHPGDAAGASFRRLATAVAKYWICKRAPAVVGEALECIGGNGYAEEWDFPRWYRQAPLNSIWEGSGNVQALDVLRTCGRDRAALSIFFGELAKTAGVSPELDAFTRRAASLSQQIVAGDAVTTALHARCLLELLALALQGHAFALGAQADPSVAAAFELWCSLRLPRTSASGTSTGNALQLPGRFCFGAISPGLLNDAAAASHALRRVLGRERDASADAVECI